MIGTTVSHYKILEKLGAGGMGVVYKAQDTKLKRTVALKFLPPYLTRDEETKTRFVHEAQAASALQHPNICTIHDIDETADNQLFIVMDCYEGESLKQRIESGPLPIDKAIDITTQVAQGLAKAHESGIVHRDIKPANIMTGKDGIARIVDFGLAKLSGQTMLTKSGSTVGTAAYMSPEQARGDKVDQRADIWSLGVVLYEMLTGKRPFASDYEQALVYSILNEEPKPMLSIKGDIPIKLETIVRKAMARNPEERYQTIVEMLADLEPQGKGAVKVRSWMSRAIARKAAIVLVEFALVAGAIATIILLTAHTPEIHKMALLPLVDTSKDSTMAEVFDGLTEDVITNLGQMSKAMKVISFNGVVQYKEKQVTPVKAGEELGVDAIAVCRVYRQANNYNLRLEIINVRDNTSMSNERFTTSQSDISFLPKKMATSILKTFGVTISDDVAATMGRQQTKNFEAYRLYQQGNYHYHRLTEEDLQKSIEYYRKALAIDSNYALAHAGIALSFYQLYDQLHLSIRQALDSGQGEIRRALAIDDKLPEAHLALAMFREGEYDHIAALAELRRAIELNPSYADGVHTLGHVTFDQGQAEKGIELMLRSIELEPLNPHYQFCLSSLYWASRRWDDLYIAAQKLKEMDSTFHRPSVRRWFIDYYRAKGDSGKVIDLYKQGIAESKPGSRNWFLDQFSMKVFAGRKSDAVKYLRMCEALRGIDVMDLFDYARMYAGLQDKQNTLYRLQKMYDTRNAQLPWVNANMLFDFLRGDPQYEALMKKAGYRN